MVAFGGGVDHGGAVHVGGDDGAGDFGDEAGFVDEGAVEDPSVEIVGRFAFVDVLDEGGEGDAHGFAVLLPLDVDGEAVGSGSGRLGFLVFVGAFFAGREFFEDACGSGLVVGQEECELDLDGLYGGLEDGFVDFFANFMTEGILNRELLMEDVTGDANFAGGSGDLDAIEVEDAGGDLFEELFGVFELGFRVRLRRSGVLGEDA